MKYKSIIFCVYLLLFIFMQVQSDVSAHGEGYVFEEVKEGYTISIGYSDDQPVALDQVRFNFLTYLEDFEKPPDGELYSDVWVRIAQGRELFFSGGISKPVFGPTGFTYMFPKEGTYEVFARFQKEGEMVVESSFTIEILPPTETDELTYSLLLLFVAGFLGLILGGAVVWIHKTKKV